jgi:hypothetical protein
MGDSPEIKKPWRKRAARVGMPDVRDRLPEIARVGSSKVVGQTVEALFKYHCMRKGLIPHAPEGDPPCHDTVVFNSQSGRFKSVQVKSTSSFKNSYRNKAHKLSDPDRRSIKGNYKIKATCYNDRIALKDTYVDVLVVFVVPHNAWYVIPTKKIVSRNLNFFPHIKNSTGQYEKYRDNWRAFGKVL